MKRIGNIRKKFLTRERLILITNQLTTNEKRRDWTPAVTHDWEVFFADFENNIDRIHNQLRYQIWVPGPFKVFTKKEGTKIREIYASRPEELIVDTLLFDCLMYVFFERKKVIHPNCYGSIKGKGQHELRKKVIGLVHNRKDLYVGCWDTKKYYPTINHQVCMQILSSHIKDRWLLWLSEVCLKRMGKIGVALGLPSSNPMGHIYHSIIDWLIITRYGVQKYYRFCDDIWIIHTNKNYLHTISRELIEETANILKQTVKPTWRVLWCKEERFECLGAMINSHGARLKSFSRRRIERHMRKCIKTGDPMLALRCWSGVKGGLRDLSVSNLINYWHRVYPEFFDMIRWARYILKKRQAYKRRNKLIYNITIELNKQHESFNKK